MYSYLPDNMILNDKDIMNYMEMGLLVIEDFDPDNLTPNGYDLTIEKISVEARTPYKEGSVVIPGSSWFAVSTKEFIKFPSNVAGELWIRTSWARKGILASFGMIDAGFQGNLTLSAYNTYKKIEIPIGDTFAQMVFHTLAGDVEKDYSQRSGNYQGKRGINI